MNEESKLTQSIVSAFLSWIALAVGWVESHLATIASLFAISAAAYSIWASRDTIKLRRAERKKVAEQ